MPREVTEDYLKSLEEEGDYIKSTSKPKDRYVKLARGESALLRFLPVEMGPRKLFYARIAQHWVPNGAYRKSYFCVKNSHPDWGGDPNATCELCDISEAMNSSKNDQLRNYGWRSMGTPQWLMYCLQLELDKGEDRPIIAKGDDRWYAMKFWHNKSSFDDFMDDYKRGLSRCDDSVLSLTEGNEYIARNGKKGLILKKQDSSPLVHNDDPDSSKLNAAIDRIWATIRLPEFRVLTPDDMEEAVLKLEDGARNLDDVPRRSDDSRGQSRRNDGERSAKRDDDDDLDYGRKPHRESSDDDGEPTSRLSRSKVDDDDDVPRRRRVDDEDEAPRRRQVDDDGGRERERPVQSVSRPVVAKPALTKPSVAKPVSVSKPVSSAGGVRPPSVSAPKVAAPAKTVSHPPSVPKPALTKPVVSRPSVVESSVEDADNVTNEASDPAPMSDEVLREADARPEAEAGQETEGQVETEQQVSAEPDQGQETSQPGDDVEPPPQVKSSDFLTRLKRGIATAKSANK